MDDKREFNPEDQRNETNFNELEHQPNETWKEVELTQEEAVFEKFKEEPIDELKFDVVCDNSEKRDDAPQIEQRPVEPMKTTQEYMPDPLMPMCNKGLYYETVSGRKRKGRTFGRIVAVLVVMAMVGGGFGGLGYALGQRSAEAIAEVEPGSNTNTVQTSVAQFSAETYSGTSVIQGVAPAVVNIKTLTQFQQQTWLYGYIPYEAESAGSGVMFFEDTTKVYIVTNNHVIANATSIYVSVEDAEEVLATVVGTDPSSDIAVISMYKSDLEAVGVNSVTLAVFGDSDNLVVGEPVIVIGNSLGMGQSATGGMVSALGKSITVEGLTLNVIQTDAAINPGNSGGAMVNYNGEVVGIPTAKSFEDTVEGMGYAIPSSDIINLIEQLLEEGTLPKPYIGIYGRDMSESDAEIYSLPLGALVTDVIEGSPAEQGGLQKGDIVISVNGTNIETMEELQTIVGAMDVGETVNLVAYRQGAEEPVSIVIGDRNA